VRAVRDHEVKTCELSSELLRHVYASGFTHAEALIHLFIGGSELHGAKVGTTDDVDIYGVFVESPHEALGLSAKEHFVWSTASDDRRNGPEDVDITLYSLRKWAGLAARGNATCLHFLFADATASSKTVWKDLQSHCELFLSRQSAEQFIGFARNQKQRITGEKGRGAKGRRPEYECAFGYDTKAAMHCLRLFFECIELMQEGRITLPRPERELLVEVRHGSWTLERFLREAQNLEARAIAASENSKLSAAVSKDAISELIARLHVQSWKDQSLI
jgi:uncharacterized protein